MNFPIESAQTDRQLWLYSSLARLRFLNQSYPAKIMLVAFLGTHVPLLALLLSFLVSNSYTWEMTLRVLAIALLATLAGTAATLYALHHLLTPVILTSAGLKKYLDSEILPELPVVHLRLRLLPICSKTTLSLLTANL